VVIIRFTLGETVDEPDDVVDVVVVNVVLPPPPPPVVRPNVIILRTISI